MPINGIVIYAIVIGGYRNVWGFGDVDWMATGLMIGAYPWPWRSSRPNVRSTSR
jgi:hypothetical protein